MKCPFFEEVKVAYCKGFPVRKMIPITSMTSPCQDDYESCPVYKSSPMVTEMEKQKLGVEEKYCVWLKQEVISYRLCTRNYECNQCEFEQMIADTDGKYKESPEVVKEINKALKLPGHQRRCKYVLMGNTKKIPCDKDYECFRCEIYTRIREAVTTEVGSR